MIRTQIQLSEADYSALKETAQRSHRSMADCVREAVATYVAASNRMKEDFAAIEGKFQSIPCNDLKPHDRHLASAIQGRDG